MDVFIEKTKVEKKIIYAGTVKGLLLKLKINPETVIVTRENTIITEEDTLKDKDKIKIISVISGG